MMSPPRHSGLFDATRRRAPRATWSVEALLRALGATPAFADDVLGDLAQERARRTAEDGALAARWWYLREALRSAPHLAWNALRHGGVRGRARVAAIVAGVACIPAVLLLAPLTMDGPPVRLAPQAQGGRDLSDGIVVNTRHPVRLVVHAVDARGKVLRSSDVRYQWVAGTPVSVSRAGVVTCRHRGDSEVRASLGSLATTVRLRCEPVVAVSVAGQLELVAGGPARDLAFHGVGPGGEVVNRLAGEVSVDDSTIATLTDGRLVPLSPGRTYITIRVGDAKERATVTVFERVTTFAGLRDDQHYVVAPVHLSSGDTVRLPLPTTGRVWLSYHPAPGTRAIPAMAVLGRVRCGYGLSAGIPRTPCVARPPGAFVRLINPASSGTVLDGSLLLDWESEKD